MKSRFDDHVITMRALALSDGSMLRDGTLGFVIEAFESPEAYEVEFYLGDDQVLATVQPEDLRSGEHPDPAFCQIRQLGLAGQSLNVIAPTAPSEIPAW